MSWLDQFLSAYNSVQSNGAALPQRSVLNFAEGATAEDNPTDARTDISVTSIPTLISGDVDGGIDVGDANTSAIDLHTGGSLVLTGLATTTSAPSAGGGGALPATPAGYVSIVIGVSTRKIAYY